MNLRPQAPMYEDSLMINVTMPDLTLVDDESLFDYTTNTMEAHAKQLMSTGDMSTIMSVSPQGSSSSNSTNNFSDTTPNSGGNIINGRSPFKRRSRTSKKAATTLLSANAANFRDLVQKYTGRNSCTIPKLRGPINLNFTKYRYDHSKKSLDATAIEQQQQFRISNFYNNEARSSDRSFSSFVSKSNVCVSSSVTTCTANYTHDPSDVPTSVVLTKPRSDLLSLVDDSDQVGDFSLPEFSGPDQDCNYDLQIDDFWGC